MSAKLLNLERKKIKGINKETHPTSLLQSSERDQSTGTTPSALAPSATSPNAESPTVRA